MRKAPVIGVMGGKDVPEHVLEMARELGMYHAHIAAPLVYRCVNVYSHPGGSRMQDTVCSQAEGQG
jgi:hypothetical protein